MHERKDDTTGTSEMKAFGEELLATGARLVETGRRWLHDRRAEMGSHDTSRDRYGSRGGRHDDDGPQPTRRGGDDRDPPYDDGRNAWLGGRGRDQDRYGAERDTRSDTGYGDPAIAEDREWQQQWRRDDDRFDNRGAGGAGAPYAQFARSQDPQRDPGSGRRNTGRGDTGRDQGARGVYGAPGGLYDDAYGRGDRDRGGRRAGWPQSGGDADDDAYASGWDSRTRSGYDDRFERERPGGGGGQGRAYTDTRHSRTGGTYDDSAGSGRAHSSGYGRETRAAGDDRDSGYSRTGARTGGGWRGTGPKGYTRSDARITEDVCEQLMDDDDVDAREISVRVSDGVVTLEGQVDARRTKHRIEDIAERCAGVKDVDNRVRVRRSGSGTDTTSGLGMASNAQSSSESQQGGTSSERSGSNAPAAGSLATSARQNDDASQGTSTTSGSERKASTASSQTELRGNTPH